MFRSLVSLLGRAKMLNSDYWMNPLSLQDKLLDFVNIWIKNTDPVFSTGKLFHSEFIARHPLRMDDASSELVKVLFAM